MAKDNDFNKTKEIDLDKYSSKLTILLWTRQKRVIGFIESYAEVHGFNIFFGDRVEDLIAVPCFLAIVDTEFLTEKNLILYNQYAKLLDPDYFRLLITGKKIVNAPEFFKKIMVNVSRQLSESFLNEIITEMQILNKNKKRKDIQKQKIYRIMCLYHFLREGSVDADSFCAMFEISLRTLRRDINDLKEAREDITIENFNDGYYYMNFNEKRL